jgi:hypothetical protein
VIADARGFRRTPAISDAPPDRSPSVNPDIMADFVPVKAGPHVLVGRGDGPVLTDTGTGYRQLPHTRFIDAVYAKA